MIILKELIKKYSAGILFNPNVVSIQASTDELGKCDIHIESFLDQGWDFDSEITLYAFWHETSISSKLKKELQSIFSEEEFEKLQQARAKSLTSVEGRGLPHGVSLYFQDTLIGWIPFIDSFIYEHIDF